LNEARDMLRELWFRDRQWKIPKVEICVLMRDLGEVVNLEEGTYLEEE
jgi:hypothetical protein